MPINNPNGRIDNEFPEFQENRPLYWLKPTDTVAELDAMMDMYDVRHIPIIEPINPTSDEPRGELKAVISKTDLVKILTPPNNQYPIEFPLTPSQQSAVQQFTKDINAKRINEIPEFIALMSIPVKTLLLGNSTNGDVFDGLINRFKPDGQNVTLRYRTLFVYGANQLIVGQISYTDVLRKINDPPNYTQFLMASIDQNSLFKKANELTVLTENDNLLQARGILKGNSFTHIPITTPDGRFVTGVVDDVIVNTFLHPILLGAFAKLPLKDIMLPVNERNSVSPGDRTSKVIETFVPSNSKDRPTALVVCTTDPNSGKFTLEGIISYTDIFRGFQNWAN
ncbi:MAG: CBS domain-containing protein [Oscillatoriales cyanobacterium]|uniref:CBS domain-containing protein n=1 Tax=Microcoleus anatoxicus PTRS2 TaxID=2705321 RepID=A0ABU8YR80_9CYAN|nr:MAG: CBS domain-containing protein [Oscillatoriales cyanobacterium]TAD92722.1 MAG: CBS domain-containing protein [Oscillatoriales cyanobacterium]TAE03676.1 MAG: CBS domain-containing protein [Oscillatoriales cyanobacterium]TAF03944.1 MAG: CBS domain-containing protein [Oscillatoriales cyanobacterium]TAF71666.1 MAG: CBS domain-containing protein [Oscillatoriales cyanobacterium]